MKPFLALILALLVSSPGLAQSRLPIWKHPHVIAHMAKIWRESRNGTELTEASFVILANRHIADIPMTYQSAQETFVLPPTTVMIFHTHPNDFSPEPSDADEQIANKYKVYMFVESRHGLTMYSPFSHRIHWLANNLDYLK
jgi:hypothetical protein